jgi:CheY-like chemotaxis protein
METIQAKKILAVDDQSNWQTVFRTVLSSPKYELHIERTIDDGQNALRHGIFDLVIVNLNLIDSPEMPNDQLGLELLKFIQDNYPSIPRIVITGDPGGGILSKFVPLGVKEVLIKSKFKAPDLIEAIEKVVNPNNDKSTQLEDVGSPIQKQKTFDVFLAYNSQDKPAIETLAERLKQHGLKPWLDTEQIPPGRWLQDVVQEALRKVKSIAIFVGKDGIEKWEALELRTSIRQCINAEIPVIPVLLPEAENIPEDLPFLSELQQVAFKEIDDPEALNRFIYGISGKHP